MSRANRSPLVHAVPCWSLLVADRHLSPEGAPTLPRRWRSTCRAQSATAATLSVGDGSSFSFGRGHTHLVSIACILTWRHAGEWLKSEMRLVLCVENSALPQFSCDCDCDLHTAPPQRYLLPQHARLTSSTLHLASARENLPGMRWTLSRSDRPAKNEGSWGTFAGIYFWKQFSTFSTGNR